MELLSVGHKGCFCGMCCFETRLVRMLGVDLGELERQLIVDGAFKHFRKQREVIPADICRRLRDPDWVLSGREQPLLS